MTAAELHAQKVAKAEAAANSSAHLNYLDAQKRANFEAKKNDTTNYQ